MDTSEIIDKLVPEKTLGETVAELLSLNIGGFSLGNILAAALIFLVCLVLIKLCLKLTRRALDRSRLDPPIRRAVRCRGPPDL